MKAKIYQLQSLLNKINNPYVCLLFYGTDEGEINKGFQEVKTSLGCNSNDLNIAHLTAEQIKKNPFIATDEANTISLMGGQRILLIEEESSFSEASLTHFLDNKKSDAILLIKAGNLAKTSALRKEAEDNPFVLAFACYPPSEAELKKNIQGILFQAKKTASQDVLDILVQKLSSNAGIVQQEIDKLLLYLGDKKSISIQDIDAIITDSKETTFDDFCIMLAAGQTRKTQAAIKSFLQQNTQLSPLLWNLTNYFTILAKLTESKNKPDVQEKILAKNLKPNQFKVKPFLLEQAHLWTYPQTLSVLNKLQNLEKQTRQNGIPAETLIAHTCLQLSEFAKKLTGMR